jgi:rhamnosyltransferase
MQNQEKDLPQVAVLMATYNGEKYLRQQLDSIMAQKNIQLSIYVRDDRSSDNTTGIIREYVKATGKVFLLDTASEQLNVTRNFFSIVKDIDLADVDYISYSDQDDIWLDNKLDAAITAIKNNQVSCYASNLLRGNTNGVVNKQRSVVKDMLNYILNYKSNRQLPFDHYFEAASAGCTLVMNKEAAIYLQQQLIRIYDLIPVNASHDWSTYAITKLGGHHWFIDSNAYMIYRQHNDNAYGTNTGMKGVSKLLDLFRSGWYRKHILMIDDLYNATDLHPAFINTIRIYDPASVFSRFRVAVTVCRHRRKPVHRIILFLLILFGYFK